MNRRWKARRAASQDIDDIVDYIRVDNIDAAIRFVRATEEAFDLLAEFPRAGPIQKAASARLRDLRRWTMSGSFANYLILYLEQPFGVEIPRVVHGARDMNQIIDRLR